jgi:hypothetical protein
MPVKSSRINRTKGDILLIDLDEENPDFEKICEIYCKKHNLEVAGEALMEPGSKAG